MTYSYRYRNAFQAAPAIDLLMLDASNPRAVAFQIQAILRHAADLPMITEVQQRGRVRALAENVHARIAAVDAYALAETQPRPRTPRVERAAARRRAHDEAHRRGAGRRVLAAPAGGSARNVNYTVMHRTTYSYHSDVAYSRLVAHLVPRATPRQRSFAIRGDPRARTGQPLASLRFLRQRDELVHDRRTAHGTGHLCREPGCGRGDRGRTRPKRARTGKPSGPHSRFPPTTATREALQYTFDTPLTAGDDEIVAYARRSFPRGRPLFACVLDLNARIHADFTFDKEATDTRTTVKQAFELRAGVCQDLAHVGLATVRSMGLAARYVSGYLLTHPPPGRERLIGADASHAWFSVWIPPFGWVDFDPTNDMLPSDEHITVAWGRDYGDVAPIHGIITGGSEHEVEVAVDVMPL